MFVITDCKLGTFYSVGNIIHNCLLVRCVSLCADTGSVLIGTVSDVIHSRSISCMLFFGLAVPAVSYLYP